MTEIRENYFSFKEKMATHLSKYIYYIVIELASYMYDILYLFFLCK